LLETWNDFISPSSIAYDYGEDIALEEFNFRLYEARKIFNKKLKEAKDYKGCTEITRGMPLCT
jgi:hypothetical protein